MKILLILLIFFCFCAGFACADEKPSSNVAKARSENANTSEGQADKAAQSKDNLPDTRAPKLTPHRLELSGGKSLTLYLPADYEITIATAGFKRPRFLVKSPDNRVFMTAMYSRADNKRGAVFILDDFDGKTGKFNKATPYLTNLRNPNSVAFYKDKAGQHWFYVALTDRLIRYRYTLGEMQPTSEPEVLATFPDYGLGYKYGGWHLTRTIAFNDAGKLYISVGSSCNACEEKEDVRASVIEMDADGKNQRLFARGVRNAVGLKWVDGKLYATNMGQDKLGDDKPEDNLYTIEDGKNYGWPSCYEFKEQMIGDPLFSKSEKRVDCKEVPLAFVGLGAHSSPLGLEYFDAGKATDAKLKDSFLVALHGSSKKTLKRGYRLVRARKGYAPHDFITGFLRGTTVLGRPAGVLRLDANSFFFTDDFGGRVFYVYQKKK
jgi:glucose/arabinose dehydrogenase